MQNHPTTQSTLPGHVGAAFHLVQTRLVESARVDVDDVPVVGRSRRQTFIMLR